MNQYFELRGRTESLSQSTFTFNHLLERVFYISARLPALSVQTENRGVPMLTNQSQERNELE